MGLVVWPNPFNPAFAVNGVLKAEQVPAGATLSLYTLSGELTVGPLGEVVPGRIEWNGRNKQGAPVSPGIYYFVIENGGTKLLVGKILVQAVP
jgi:hypothetical protein